MKVHTHHTSHLTTTKNACSCFFPLLGIYMYNCVCVYMCVYVCLFVCVSNSDTEPSVDLLLDQNKVMLYSEWIHRWYYNRGRTGQNKCLHLAWFLNFLEGVKDIGNNPMLHAKIVLCCSIFNQHVQTAKVRAIRQRSALSNEDQYLEQGTILSIS